MQTTTTFDTSEHHIYLAAKILDCNGVEHSFRGVLDTGAPATEFSDEFLLAVGILEPQAIKKVDIHPEQQTARYGRIVLPRIQCLGQTMENTRVKVVRFVEGWAVDALIGLDFFRRYEVKINYKSGTIVTEGL